MLGSQEEHCHLWSQACAGNGLDYVPWAICSWNPQKAMAMSNTHSLTQDFLCSLQISNQENGPQTHPQANLRGSSSDEAHSAQVRHHRKQSSMCSWICAVSNNTQGRHHLDCLLDFYVYACFVCLCLCTEPVVA